MAKVDRGVITSFSWQACGSPYLMFLIVLYVTFSITGTVLLNKVVQVGPGLAPGGLFCLPLVLMIEDIIAEVYGYKISRLILWFIFLSLFIFSSASLIIIHLPSPVYWHLRPDFNAVFDPLVRIAPALILSLFVSRFLNIYILTKTKILFKGKMFWLRSIFSTLVGSAFGLVIIFGLSFWHEVPIHAIEVLIGTDFTVRGVYAIFGGAPAWGIAAFLKKREKINVFDVNTNFNPFKLTVED